MSDIAVNNRTGYTSGTTDKISSQDTTANDYLGKDAFLTLLITQLQNQDPLEPMDNKESIAQLAQFSALEQMNNVADGMATLNSNMVYFSQQFSLLQGASMIGKYVSGLEVDGETPMGGIVESVRWLDGDPYLLVRKEDGSLAELEMYLITSVHNEAPPANETGSETETGDDSTAETQTDVDG